MKWNYIDDNAEQINILLSSLGFRIYSEAAISKEAIISEYLRDCIYKLALYDLNTSDGITPVHTTRIRNVLNQQLGAIWPEKGSLKFSRLNKEDINQENDPLGSDSIKHKLTNLGEIGDVEHIGNGFWVPTPTRLVQLPEQEHIALIGGTPTKYTHALSKSISQDGLGRLIKREDIGKRTMEERNLWQPYKQWVGWIPENLSHWTEKQMELAHREGGNTLSSFEGYEIFNTLQSSRHPKATWIKSEEARDIPDKTVLLCKTRDKRVHYFLGVFQNKKIIKEFSVRDKESVAWLRIGLRIINGKKNVALWTGNELKIFAPLPLSLERQILLYSYKIKPSPKKTFYVMGEHKGSIEKLLKKYGFNFKKSRGGALSE